MTSIRSFQEIPIWSEAHQLVLDVYALTDRFPNSEKFGIVDQLRRASASVVANIVEGHNRRSCKEKIQFLYQSKGSLAETQYFLLLSKDLGYYKGDEFEKLYQRYEAIAKQLGGWIKYLKGKDDRKCHNA